MQTNALPRFDTSDNPAGCCPRFNQAGWDGVTLHLRDLPVMRATTRSMAHIPLNMGRVMARVLARGQAAGAFDPAHHLVLSRDLSAFSAEHLFHVTRPVEGEEMTTLSGDFLTRCFDGPYRQAGQWCKEMEALAREQGHEPGRVFFFYTTCPNCAREYGHNPVVGLVELT